jgi:hypothetical protein
LLVRAPFDAGKKFGEFDSGGQGALPLISAGMPRPLWSDGIKSPVSMQVENREKLDQSGTSN